MAKSTKTTYKPAKKGNYKSVVRMAEGGNVSELDYSERREYIEENYAPFITDAQMIFSIYDSGIEYDYKGDRKQVTQSIIEQYKSLADYTESTLPQETIYEIQDWDLVRKEIDPDTDEVIGETPLEQVSSDNTYNFSYNGLVDLNWRVYHDEEYDRFFYVIMPHLGGDIRGNYGDAIILEGNDKEELFYRFYEGFISGGASIYIKFKDGSEIGFDSEQDSDVFYFRVNEVFEPTGMAQKYLNDFEKFDSWKGDEFLEETIDIYLARNGVVPMMMAGGSLNDENPMAYIQILGYDEGKYFNLTDYADGQDVINGIYEWMNGLNEQFGGNREEYEVTDYEGFGDDLYDAYMGENEFDEIIEAYEKYQSSDFPADVISAYKNDSGSRNDSLSDVIDEMDNNYFGKYENLKDFGYEMVQQGVYEPSENDVYITDTDKRIIAGEEADSKVDDMRFEDLMDVALDTQSDYENEKSELEDKISEIQSEIDDLTDLQSSVDDDDEYETIAEQIEEKEVELDDVQNELDNIDSRFEDEAREEARELFYDEIYNKLENDLEDWLYEYGYNTGNLADVSFLSIDYEKIGDELSSDYLIVEFDGSMYFFNNYSKGGRIMASKIKPKFDYYIVENNTKKLVSGYSTKGEAIEQRKLLVKEYPSMRFEIFTLGNLEKKTDLDVYAKKDYVELSTLDKIKKVSVDAYRYGQEKVGQAQVFLERNDVKGKIKRGARKVTDKTKQGGNWLKKQWREADFGDGTGRARFFADGGGVAQLPPKGELTNKDNLLLKYQKNGSEYEFYIYEPVTKNVSAYQQNKYLCKNKDCPIKMTYNQFINYLYTETYLDDLEYENGGGVGKTQTQLDAYKFVDEIVEIHKDKKKVKEVILDRVNSAYGRTSNQFVDSMWDRYNMIFYKEDYPHLFDNGGGVELTRGDIEDKIQGLKLRIAKTKKEVSSYESTNRGKYNKLWQEKVVPLQKELDDLSELWGKSKYANGGGVSKNYAIIHFADKKPIKKRYDSAYKAFIDYEEMGCVYAELFNEKGIRLSSYPKDKFADGGESKDEYDVYDNKRMLENQANEVEHHAEELSEQVSLTKKVPAWVVAKMERATTDLSDITHYLDGENKMEKGGELGDVNYEIIPLPSSKKFIIVQVIYLGQKEDENIIRDFNGNPIKFDDIKSAQKFIDNIVIKYPFGGVEKASYGAILLASQFAQKQQPQQIVYYIPQQQQEPNTGIIQNIPEMANGGDVGYDDETINDFCITNLIELANELQSVRYYVTNRFKESDFESKTYKGRLTIVFKEPASINVINSLSKFLERAEDCHHIFEQSVNVSGSEANGLSINLLSDKFSDFEFGKGGKVYDFAPKKINISKTKKITTHLGDFNLALITKDFVYFVNMEESDENGNTMMYNKNGELLSDNYFASNELYETLEKESTFDFIHPMMEIQRQEILKEN